MSEKNEVIKGMIVVDRKQRGGLDVSSWRMYVPVVDPEKCSGCMVCALYCPEAAIHANQEGKPEVDMRFCKGCGVCANECPTKTLKMAKEEE